MAYCVKCRAPREIDNPDSTVMKNGRSAVAGICPICGTRLFRIGEAAAESSSQRDPSSMGPENHQNRTRTIGGLGPYRGEKTRLKLAMSCEAAVHGSTQNQTLEIELSDSDSARAQEFLKEHGSSHTLINLI
jgi:hypothetical protein